MDVTPTLEGVQSVRLIVRVDAADNAAAPSKVVDVLAAPTVRLPEPEQVPLIVKLLAKPFAISVRFPDCSGKLKVEVTGPLAVGDPPPPPHAAKSDRLADKTRTLRAKRLKVGAWNIERSH